MKETAHAKSYRLESYSSKYTKYIFQYENGASVLIIRSLEKYSAGSKANPIICIFGGKIFELDFFSDVLGKRKQSFASVSFVDFFQAGNGVNIFETRSNFKYFDMRKFVPEHF